MTCSKSAKWLILFITCLKSVKMTKSAKWLNLIMTCLKSAKCVCAFYGLKLLSIFKIDIHREWLMLLAN